MTKRLRPILILNGLIFLTDVVVFSSVLLNIQMDGKSALQTSFGVMIISMSVVVFCYGNYKLLFSEEKTPAFVTPDKEIKTLEDCEVAVKHYIANNVKTFSAQLQTIVTQVGRMKKKRGSVKQALAEHFSETEMSYQKFLGAVSGIEQIMIINIRSLIRRLDTFDEEEYEKLYNNQTYSAQQPDKLTASKLSLFNEYVAYVAKAVENNEEMLLRIDKLVLEISKLDGLAEGTNIDDIVAIQEIDDLIKDTKWYR